MEENSVEIQKKRNSGLTVVLIVVNVFLALLYANVTDNSEDQTYINYVWLAGSLTFLLGGFAFTYHGKDYRWGKWLFALLLIVSLGFLALLIMATGLEHAFHN